MATDNGTVFLLHGIILHSQHMASLAEYLKVNNYTVHNIDYPSSQYDIASSSQYLDEKIGSLIPEFGPVHYVGYSLGGLILRTMETPQLTGGRGRMVHIAPPHHGTELADFAMNKSFLLPAFERIYGPAGLQLGTDQSDIRHLFHETKQELGIIAAEIDFAPFSEKIFPGPHDGVVAVESTKLKDMSDHILVKGTHLFLPRDNVVKEKVHEFICHGFFTKPVLVEEPVSFDNFRYPQFNIY